MRLFWQAPNYWGIYPDYMHVVHLALGVDAVSSVILDLCDHPALIEGNTRDEKLSKLHANYKEWCEATSTCDMYFV